MRHKALTTERSYIQWVHRFMRHCRSQDLQGINEAEIKGFLTMLAVEGDVTATTQNQAKCALLFLCFDEGHIVVRSGKGDKDRITVLPERCCEALREQIEQVRRLHERDLSACDE